MFTYFKIQIKDELKYLLAPMYLKPLTNLYVLYKFPRN